MSMDARFYICATLCAAMWSVTLNAASHRTTNFIVDAPNQRLATEIAKQAEAFRRDLAIEWLGKELPRWTQPCPIQANVNPGLGAGGMTKFTFYNGRPFDWEMSVQGSRERILDSVLPHEVTHTVFASHFGQPLPRWADEGACTTVEHKSEQKKQESLLIQFIEERRGIPFNRMFVMKKYPRDLLPLYAQGHSVAQYLIQQGGKRKFVQFVGAGLESNNWHASLKQYYNYDRIADLQIAWEKWVGSGRPKLDGGNQTILASSNRRRSDVNVSPNRLTSTRPRIQRRQLASDSITPEKGSWYARTSNAQAQDDRISNNRIASAKSSSANPKRVDRNRTNSKALGDTDWQSLSPSTRKRYWR